MKIYCKGYYGYKNFGDELLLLGMIHYLVSIYKVTKIYVEADDVNRLQVWLDRNEAMLPAKNSLEIVPVSKRANFFIKRDLTVFGGGEVVSDARTFPYNGWTYLFWFFATIFRGEYILLGGVGTIKSPFTKILYYILLGNARHIVVRDKQSYAIAKKFNESVKLHNDFAYDLLPKLIHKNPTKRNLLIVNCNPYIWSEQTKQKILEYVRAHPNNELVYIGAESSVDNQYFDLLKKDIPTLTSYDRTHHTLAETVTLLMEASYGIAARLHILLLLDYGRADYKPLVYQEKITKVLGEK